MARSKFSLRFPPYLLENIEGNSGFFVLFGLILGFRGEFKIQIVRSEHYEFC